MRNEPIISEQINDNEIDILQPQDRNSESFIEANTYPIELVELREKHIIPVFIKDNEPLISHSDFIDSSIKVALDVFQGERILSPSIRISHPIKGRIPSARNKPAIQLRENEKTLYYERMAFICSISSIKDVVGDSPLSLCFGGVKAYNLDNLSNKKGADEHFKIFIGFQNKLCTNLCIWTDGFKSDLRVSSKDELELAMRYLFTQYQAANHLQKMKLLHERFITEKQFAHLIGRCRMYKFLSNDLKSQLPVLSFGDSQINQVCKDYYSDNSFAREPNGNINLWKLYNLFTGANKSSYIDTYLDRASNAFDFVEDITMALNNEAHHWFLN